MNASDRDIGTVWCIVIEGSDARRFAQAQFSGNVDTLTAGHWQWNAWLTPQGRVRALMHLVDLGDGALLALLRGGDAEEIRTALARYRLRAQVNLTAKTFMGRLGDPLAYGVVELDADDVVLGYGARSLRLSPMSKAAPDAAAQQAWRLADIRQGWPTLPGQTEFLPPALDLERLGAVAFDKGCYPGQEIAARLHYRGGHKYRLCRLLGSAPLPLGEIREASVWILDAVSGSEGTEVLAVAPIETESEISILTNIYEVYCKFHA